MKPLFYTLALLAGVADTAMAGVVFQLGADFGGETLVKAQFTNGESEEIKAGQLLHLAAGVVTKPADNYEAQFTIGYKLDRISAENGDVNWTRFPLEAILFSRQHRWRFGAGATLHLNPKITGSGDANRLGNIGFDNALGLVAQVDYLTNDQFSMGVRATFIEYDTKFGAAANGNSAGFVLTLRIK